MSKNLSVTGHDGIFAVPKQEAAAYVARYKPQVLRYDRRTNCDGYDAINFGEAKGLTFDRVLIYPHGPLQKLLKTGSFSHITGSASKVYVGVTRARQSVTFVYDGACGLAGITSAP